MFGFLLRGATYYILWQKFQKQIILITISLIAIFAIAGIYDDLFKVLKVSHKETLLVLFLVKWFLIALIIGFNIYKLKEVKVEDTKEVITAVQNNEKKIYPKKSTNILRKKEKLQSTTDIILKKYINE